MKYSFFLLILFCCKSYSQGILLYPSNNRPHFHYINEGSKIKVAYFSVLRCSDSSVITSNSSGFFNHYQKMESHNKLKTVKGVLHICKNDSIIIENHKIHVSDIQSIYEYRAKYPIWDGLLSAGMILVSASLVFPPTMLIPLTIFGFNSRHTDNLLLPGNKYRINDKKWGLTIYEDTNQLLKNKKYLVFREDEILNNKLKKYVLYVNPPEILSGNLKMQLQYRKNDKISFIGGITLNADLYYTPSGLLEYNYLSLGRRNPAKTRGFGVNFGINRHISPNSFLCLELINKEDWYGENGYLSYEHVIRAAGKDTRNYYERYNLSSAECHPFTESFGKCFRTITGIQIKYGSETMSKKMWYRRFYIGLGLRYEQGYENISKLSSTYSYWYDAPDEDLSAKLYDNYNLNKPIKFNYIHPAFLLGFDLGKALN